MKHRSALLYSFLRPVEPHVLLFGADFQTDKRSARRHVPRFPDRLSAVAGIHSSKLTTVTPRSKKYLARKKLDKSVWSIAKAFAVLWDEYHRAMATMKPIPWSPQSMRQSGAAIVGQVGPDLLMRQDGTMFLTHSRLVELTPNGRVFPVFQEDSEPSELPVFVKDGIFDVSITNAFTPFAKTTIKRITPGE